MKPLRIFSLASLISLFFLSFFSSLSLWAKINVELDPPSGKIGIKDQLTVNVTHDQSDSPVKILLDHFLNLGQRSSFTSVSIINGQYSKKKTLGYALQPQKKGIFTLTVEVNGEKSEPYQIEVVDGSLRQQRSTPAPQVNIFNPFRFFQQVPQRPQKQISQDAIFIENQLSKKKLYINEIAILKTFLYIDPTQVNLRLNSIRVKKNFSHLGISLTQIENITPSSKQVKKNNKTYQRYLIMQHLAYPLYQGKLEIKDGVFSVENNIYRVNVKPVFIQAEKYPFQDFNNQFGDFSIKTSLSSTEIEINEPITLKIEISGQGNFKSLTSPLNLELKGILSPQVEVKKGKVTENYQTTSITFVGEKIYEYYLIPRRAGTISLDPVVYKNYSPSKKKVVTHREKLPALKVESLSTLSPNLLGSTGKVEGMEETRQNIAQEIEYIETELPPPPSFKRNLLIYHVGGSIFLIIFLFFSLFSTSSQQKKVFRNKTYLQRLSQLSDLKTKATFESKKQIISQLKDLWSDYLLSFLIFHHSQFKTQKEKAKQLTQLKNLKQKELRETIKGMRKNLTPQKQQQLAIIQNKMDDYEYRVYSSKNQEFDFESEITELTELMNKIEKSQD